MVLKIRNNSISVIDIGSSKTVCLTAKISSTGIFEIIGIGYCATQGIKSGIITDLKAASESINKAITGAEISSGEKIKSIFVGLSPQTIISEIVQCETGIIGKKISEKDLQKIVIQAIEPYEHKPQQIIHTFLFDYFIDQNRNITSPIGLFGDNFGCKINILSANSNVLLNYSSCLNQKRKIEITQCISSIYATALASSQVNELENGVTIIDFGGGTTSIAVFENSSMIYSDSIDIGGKNITKDISFCFGIDIEQSEKIKNLYGGIIETDHDSREKISIDFSLNLDENAKYDAFLKMSQENLDLIKKSNKKKEYHWKSQQENNESYYYNNINDEIENDVSNIGFIYRSELINIIRPRIEEILEILLQRLNTKKIIIKNKIIVTGGTSRLPGICELVNHMFSVNTRHGFPKMVQNIDPSINLELAAVIGMLIHIADQDNEYLEKNNEDYAIKTKKAEQKQSFIQKLYKFFGFQ